MKHAREALLLVFLLVTPLLLTALSVPIESVTTEASVSPSKTMTLSYENHAMLNLVGDEMFHDRADTESWDGDGSELTPYIIEGYNFSLDTTCITLVNISVYFEIRGCYFSYATSLYGGNGLYFVNVTHATIVDSIFESKDISMWLGQSHNIVIENCTIRDSPSSGIILYESNDGIVSDCDISTNNNPIQLLYSNNTVIANNVLHDSVAGVGVWVYDSNLVVVEGNEVFSCGSGGIRVILSNNCTMENNVIYDNMFLISPDCGIYLDFGHNATIIGNEIYDNAQNGIFAANSDWVCIFDNEIYNNSDHGIDVVNSANGTIIKNDIHSNGWWPIFENALCGVYLGGGTIDWVVSDNSIWNNTPAGITLEGSARALVRNNDIFNNTDEGIYADNCAQLHFLENQIHGNGWEVVETWEGHGITTTGNVVDSRIEGNEVYNNTHYGIYAYGNRNDIIGNEVYDHPDWGIAIIMCMNDTVSDNLVYNNDAAGIMVYSIGSNITDNIVFDNEIGVHLYGSQYCRLWKNDVGWNDNNALEESGIHNNMWYNNVTDVGNWWSDWNGTGVYYISNGTHLVYSDMFPSKSLDLAQASSINFEILDTDNYVTWEASALNPSHYEVFVDGSSVLVEDWDGGNIEYVADGLAHGTHTVGIVVFHISGHSIENGTTADVEDLTPPVVDGQAHVVITFGDTVSVQFTAVDPSAIESWAVNDTVNFAISSTGLFTSIVDLPVGDYVVVVMATDIYGNTGFADITITVHPAPDGGLGTTMILLAGAGGAVVIIVVLVVILKKKQT